MPKAFKPVDFDEYEKKISRKLVPGSASDSKLIEKRQQQIVDRVCPLFYKKGYHNSTMGDIAKAAKMSMGQLYHYISSKDDILFLVHKKMHEGWTEQLLDSGFDKIEDPIERLQKALRVLAKYISKNRELFLFVYTESKHLSKGHLKVILEMDDTNVVGLFRDLLKDIDNGNYENSDIEIYSNLIAFILVFLPLRGWNLKKENFDDCSEIITDFIMRGLTFQRCSVDMIAPPRKPAKKVIR